MADQIPELLHELAFSNRVLAYENVLEAFGHVSVRDPKNPDRYWLSRSRAPELVEPGDIDQYDLESQPIKPLKRPPYSERVIHGEIYKARPDVMAVCHHHAPAFMPHVITGIDFEPVFHLGATGGSKPPFWDQYDEFGATNMLVVKPEEGASLAKRLGDHNMVLMNRHGVTAVGTSIKDVTFRCVYSCLNAIFQVRAMDTGRAIDPLREGEVEMCGKIASSTTGQDRAWEYWTSRVTRAGNAPPMLRGSGSSRPAKTVAKVKAKSKR